MHKNQFDKIRILAALVVIFSHHYPLTGHQAPAWLESRWLHWSVTGGVGVMVFFCISGYLVTISWYREPQLSSFLWKRILRLWPGMLGSVLCGVFLFGLLFNTLPLAEYLRSPVTWRFLLTNLTLLLQFPFLPGTFTGNPVPQVMNGVYWTIPMEFTCYLVLAGLGLAGLLRRSALLKWLLLLYIAGFLCFANPDFTGHIQHWIEYPAFFAAGALIALHREWFERHGGRMLLFITPVLVATYFLTPYTATSRFLLLPTLVIYLGNLPTKQDWFTRLGDPSYGIYLYGYPIAQSVVALWPRMDFWMSLALTFALSICAGYASWRLLESRALHWKNIRPSIPGSAVTSPLPQLRHALARSPWALVWPLLPCVAGLHFIVRHLDNPVVSDAVHSYLPMARALLDGQWSVMLRPESYSVAPLGYLWPALWNADPALIRIANMGLWVGCVGFLWRTCHLLGGVRVAAWAMLLLLSPELVRYFPSELTEPIYLFGLLGWMHAMARIIVAQERSWPVIAQGACMLTITLLSRPVLQLVAPALLLACLCGMAYGAMACKDVTAPAWHQRLPTIALSLGWGLMLPLALIIKNGILFGLWGLGTGSGVGLYLGTHPLFQGAEPSFLGLDYDVNLMTALANDPGTPHSLAGDAASRRAALWQIQSMPSADALAFFGRKLWWWLAHHPAQIETLGSALRKLRLFELSALALACIWLAWGWLRRSGPAPILRSALAPRQWALAAFVLIMFMGMLTQLLPILYNSRYSSVLLDPWLIPLVALGLGLLSQPMALQGSITRNRWSIGFAGRGGASPWPSIGILAAILLLTFGGYNLARKHEHIAIDPAHMGQTMARLEITDGDRIEVQGMERRGEREWVLTQSPAAFLVRVDAGDIERIAAANIFNALWETEIVLQTQGQRCRHAESAYQTASGSILIPTYTLPLTLPLHADGKPHRLVTHANHQLRPREPGYLRLVFHCPTGTRLAWRGTRLLESRYAWDAAAHTEH